MIYNAKYDRWVSKEGLVYRYDKKNDKLVLCKTQENKQGYVYINVSKPKITCVRLHRVVYETFVGEIPEGLQIDHINTIKNDNRLENLRCVTRIENMANPLTKKHMSETRKGKPSHTKGYTFSEFGRKFKEHFGISKYENLNLYAREWYWYKKNNKVCRWEVEDK